MRALKRFPRTLRGLLARCRDTVWFVRRLGYPWREAWVRAGWWAR